MIFKEIYTIHTGEKILKVQVIGDMIYFLTKKGIYKVDLSEGVAAPKEFLKIQDMNIIDFQVFNRKIVLLGENHVSVKKLDNKNTVFELSDINVRKIGKILDPEIDVIPLLGVKPLIIWGEKVRELKTPIEHIFDLLILDIDHDGSLEIVLQDLWGFHILDEHGNLLSSKTFGDIIVGIEICRSGKSSRLTVGAKNGTIFILDDKFTMEKSININKPLKVFSTCCPDGELIVWSNFEPRVEVTDASDEYITTFKLVEVDSECEDLQCFYKEGKIFILIKFEKKFILGEIKKEI